MPSSLIRFTLVMVGLVLLGIGSTAMSADLGGLSEEEVVSNPNSWEYRFTPYAWLPWIKGDVTIKGQQANIDTNIFSIIDDSDSIVPWMSYLEAKRGRFSGYLDAIYANIKFSGGDTRLANPIPGLSLKAEVGAGLKYEYAIVEAGGAYEFTRTTFNRPCN